MDKKSFVKGIIIGVVSSMIICSASVFAYSIGNAKLSIDKKISMLASMLDKYYVEEIDFNDIEEGIYKGMVSAVGDPYTSYLTADELTSLLEDSEGEFSGIGVEVMLDYEAMTITVVSPIDGGPAANAGILPGDSIIAVDGQKVADMESLNFAIDKKIKGIIGESVKITVFREQTGQTIDFDIIRDKIDVITVSGEILESGVGYIKLSHFSANTYDQFVETYESLKQQGMKGLILDLRNNPGGLVTSVEKIGDYILPEGILVYTIDKEGNRFDYNSDSNAIDIPITLLVNGGSASASEILSGAIQDTGFGKLVGTQTYGKGLVQGVYPLVDGSGIKITTEKYYTPNGVCIQGEGITPDYVVELPEEASMQYYVDREMDTQLDKAIEIIKSDIK